jgi:hypothetical protein
MLACLGQTSAARRWTNSQPNMKKTTDAPSSVEKTAWFVFLLALRVLARMLETSTRFGSACLPRFFSEEPGPQLPFQIVLTRPRIPRAGLPELEQS